uniref:Uncharacterized protein n=1 Tax=Oryza sativa subsp. japonica TaxID=39947 RepID=Q2QW86_ORYSJ|nr:hypothetical protein LOC_Os12g10210 [Oryza sativa Japonica Group]
MEIQYELNSDRDPNRSPTGLGGPSHGFYIFVRGVTGGAWEYGEENAREGEGRAGAVNYFLYIDARYILRVPSPSYRFLPLRSASNDNDL